LALKSPDSALLLQQCWMFKLPVHQSKPNWGCEIGHQKTTNIISSPLTFIYWPEIILDAMFLKIKWNGLFGLDKITLQNVRFVWGNSITVKEIHSKFLINFIRNQKYCNRLQALILVSLTGPRFLHFDLLLYTQDQSHNIFASVIVNRLNNNNKAFFSLLDFSTHFSMH